MRRVVHACVACAVLVAAATLGAAGTGTASAVSAAKVDKNASLTIDTNNTNVLQLDPPRERTISAAPAIRMMYDRLFDLNQDIELQPMLARKWQFSPDGLTFTVSLRTDAVFHDGSPVTPDAVKQSVNRALTLPTSTAKAAI